MGFEDDFKTLISEPTKAGFKHTTDLAEKTGVSQASLSQYLSGKRESLSLKTVSKILDALGITLPKQDSFSREICFIDAKTVEAGEDLEPPASEDYFAVPLVDEVGAGSGYIPQEKLKSWLLVWRWQSAVQHRSNLIAVEIARDADSMIPTLFPGDIVLIDRDERRVENSGKMWLVRDPMDESTKIKRVALKILPEEKDIRITYYSDNSEYPPEAYSLKEDFYNDLGRAIVGRVVWAWSDMTNK